MVKKIIFLLSFSSLLANATWWDTDWYYRIPVTINNAVENQTAKINIDFSAEGLSGNLDKNSIRIVKADDSTLVAKQEFTDNIFNDVTDTLDNGKGEIKFILEDSGTVNYYIYYDITTKPVLANSYVINGNFEHSNGSVPTNWTVGQSDIGSNAPNNEVHPIDGEGDTVTVNDSTVANTAHTGEAFHLHGYRDRDESDSKQEKVYIEKSFAVPSSNAGTVDYWFRLQGFDDVNYDYVVVTIDGQAIDHTKLSISNSKIKVSSEKYGRKEQYSNTVVDSDWTKASLDLASYAGTNITMRITSHFASDNGYRSWELLDDMEWSLNTSLSLGTQEEVPTAILSIAKDSCVLSDLINGETLPKRIPGAVVRYVVELNNTGGLAADDIELTDTLSEEFDTTSIQNLQIVDGSCDCLGVTSSSNNGANGTENGVNPIILDFGTIVAGTEETPSQKCGYFEVELQ